jgi:hypothetical protein
VIDDGYDHGECALWADDLLSSENCGSEPI